MPVNTIIEPSWSVFGPCGRCGAGDGAPCRNMRGTPKGWLPNRAAPMRNPHPGRKKVRR